MSKLKLKSYLRQPVSAVERKEKKAKSSPPEWEIILLIDNKENLNSAILYSQETLLKELKRRNVKSQYEELPTFDYLWIARRPNQSNRNEWYVLNHAIERKTTIDFDRSLKEVNETTGLKRMDEQELKMNNSGVKHKIILIHGNVNAKIKKAGTVAKIKEFEGKGYHVYHHPQNGNMDSVISLLVDRHEEIEKDTLQNPPPCDFITYRELEERASFVVRLSQEYKQGVITLAELKMFLSQHVTRKTLKQELKHDEKWTQLYKRLFGFR